MKTPKPLLALSLATSLLLPSLAQAGKESSGGGSGVACFSDVATAEAVAREGGMVTNEQLPKIESIELLDLFEWKRPRGVNGKPNLPLASPREGETYSQFVKRAVERMYETIAVSASNREAAIGNHLWSADWLVRDYGNEALVWTGTSLVHLRDEGTPLRFGGNCTLVPLAVQEGSGYGLRIFIDDRLFFHPRHSEQSRAALLLHEYLYAWARETGHTNSRATRQATGWVLASSPGLTIHQVLAKLDGLGFSTRLEGMRKTHSYGRMQVVSSMAYRSTPHSSTLKSLWQNTQQPWIPGGRNERQILDEALGFLAMHGVHPANANSLVANEILGYLKKLPASPDRTRLEAELTPIWAARIGAVRSYFWNEFGGAKGLIEGLSRFSYLTEKQRTEIGTYVATHIAARIVDLASSTLSQEEREAKRRADEAKPYFSHGAFMVYSIPEFWEREERQDFSLPFFWLTNEINYALTHAASPVSFFDLRMPAL